MTYREPCAILRLFQVRIRVKQWAGIEFSVPAGIGKVNFPITSKKSNRREKFICTWQGLLRYHIKFPDWILERGIEPKTKWKVEKSYVFFTMQPGWNQNSGKREKECKKKHQLKGANWNASARLDSTLTFERRRQEKLSNQKQLSTHRLCDDCRCRGELSPEPLTPRIFSPLFQLHVPLIMEEPWGAKLEGTALLIHYKMQ